MEMEWQDGAYYSKVFQQKSVDKIIIKYKPDSSYENYFVRLFDPSGPEVTLNSPIDNYNSSEPIIIFNCTASDDLNLTNVTLYGNWTGTWQANETNSSGINDTDYLFTKTINPGS